MADNITDRIRRCALEKVALAGMGPAPMEVPYYYQRPDPTVSDVITALGVAQVNDIGTPGQRRDAFGKIINSGLTNSSPAGRALKMIGGGILGNAITSMVTDKPFYQGLGAGFGILAGAGGFSHNN